MASLLKNLLGSSTNDRELAEDLRALLLEMRQERERFTALLHESRAAADRLAQLDEPIARVGSDVDAVGTRLRVLEQRLEALSPIPAQIQTLDERSADLAQGQQQAEARFAAVVDDSQHVRAVFEELSQKVDLAANLKEGLEAFLEVDKPFQVLRDEAGALRGQVEGTGEHLTRLREQHERLMDAHKLAMSKMEALDRRRDELGRDLQDKERRVVGVDQAVRGMEGVRQTVDAVKRELGTLKALGDALAQKTSALEAQREAVDRTLSQADGLERSMRQIDAGVRQQQENEKALGAMQDAVTALKALHEQVLERSSEIMHIQHQTEEQVGVIRHELTAAQDGMKNAVERFDFEGKGLESVSQRVADLRGALADFEHRFKDLQESSRTVSDLDAQTHALTTQVHALVTEAGQLDAEVKKAHAVRRDLEAQVVRIEAARPAVDGVLVDLELLSRTHAMVTDSLEQTQVAHGELTRMWESQSEARSWLTGAGESLDELRSQVGELQDMAPSLQVAQQLTQRISESMTAIESRGEFVEALHRKVAEIGALGADLDERGQQLRTRMDAAEQRFISLAAHAEEAERISKLVAGVAASVRAAARQATAIGKTVEASETRGKSVEGLAERTRALGEELDQRHHALEEATRKLQKVSKLRQEAAGSAQQLEELAERLDAALTTADQRVASVAETSDQLEERIADLRIVDERLNQFEERLAGWELVDQSVSRSLEQISARQGTVQALQSDLERMFSMAEQTSSDVRTITTAGREIAESRGLLDQVMERLKEIHDATDEFNERRRQLALAEERLARAEGVLGDVQSSLEALHGQQAIVDQAVEKAGSLRFLLKQADAKIESLRDERKMTADVREAISIVRDDEEAEGEADQAKAA